MTALAIGFGGFLLTWVLCAARFYRCEVRGDALSATVMGFGAAGLWPLTLAGAAILVSLEFLSARRPS